MIISTFAETGPEKCSGLSVERYSPSSLASRLGPGFAPLATDSEIHETPWGSEQNFSYAVLKRR